MKSMSIVALSEMLGRRCFVRNGSKIPHVRPQYSSRVFESTNLQYPRRPQLFFHTSNRNASTGSETKSRSSAEDITMCHWKVGNLYRLRISIFNEKPDQFAFSRISQGVQSRGKYDKTAQLLCSAYGKPGQRLRLPYTTLRACYKPVAQRYKSI